MIPANLIGTQIINEFGEAYGEEDRGEMAVACGILIRPTSNSRCESDDGGDHDDMDRATGLKTLQKGNVAHGATEGESTWSGAELTDRGDGWRGVRAA